MLMYGSLRLVAAEFGPEPTIPERREDAPVVVEPLVDNTERTQSTQEPTVPNDTADDAPTVEQSRIWGSSANQSAETVEEPSSAERPEVADASNHEIPKEVKEGNNDAPDSKRIWGATPQKDAPLPENPENATLPFVAKTGAAHTPPSAFQITARVYIDPADKLAHMDDSPISLPYWDCGVSGSTTAPLPLKDAYFRHALTTSTSWSGTDGKHPVLAVALSPLQLELNSGVSKRIEAGQVILLEDVLLPGHKMRPLGHELKVMFLTLPHQYYHSGKHHMSLERQMRNAPDPCPDPDVVPERKAWLRVWSPRKARLAVTAVMSLSLSTLAANFLGKVAPLWLAVGVGGTCFVAAATYGMVETADRAWTAVEVWREKRLLSIRSSDERRNDQQSQ